MNSQDHQLSKRDRQELNRQEKLSEQKKKEKIKLAKRIAIWLTIFISVGFGIFGLTKIDFGSSKQSLDSLITVSSTDWTKGNKEAKVILIEYSDFQCPACNAYHPLVKQLAKEYDKNIVFIYRHFPLRQIHKKADLAAQSAEAAGKQGKFFEMHDLIFENQQEWSNQNNAADDFVKYAGLLGLNTEQFKRDIDSKGIEQKVNNDYNSGVRLGVNSTPTFFLNGKKLQNPRSYNEFRSLIKSLIEQ